MSCRVALSALVLLAACSETPALNPDDTSKRWHLPADLREVSGLALAATGELLAVADERAVLVSIDPATGHITDRRQIGNPPIKGDFEGLAAMDGSVYLITSNGLLFSIDAAGAVRERDLGLANRCEVEGLTEDIGDGALWLVCKKVLGDGRDHELHFFNLDPDEDAPPTLRTIELAAILAETNDKSFSPSALAFSPGGDALLILAARQEAFAMLSWPTGEVIAAGELPGAHFHRQSEGLLWLRTGFYIADEGGNRAGTLAHYPSDWLP